jgi:NADH:ubiquinone oxidoreductase subunit 3 (subunit A)
MDSAQLLSTPAAIFLIIFATSAVLSFLFAFLAYKRDNRPDSLFKSYSCGEEVEDRQLQPDYRQFFHFAFYFTILHVVALFVSTFPVGISIALPIATVYILGAFVGLYILLEN